uniref:ribosomal protein L10 n=1 Tax=Syzygium samarangense TaxID=260143 RepID=UPI002551E6A8|nr:ribosomal protein L10 [Syzygium samarangense]WGM81743.1 ribosomal protein L10 [Syzygium samarangense]
MPFGRSLLQRESLLRVSGEERSQEILISFHSSGSTSNQWRKLKNPWFPGRTSFRPSCCGTGKKKRFFAQLAHSAGPTCISYLAEEASDRLEFLPSWDSMDHDLLSLVGQYRSTLVDHMDVEKAYDLDELETSLFHFYLPSSYLCFVCSREEFYYCESRLVPENALPLKLGFQIFSI